MNAPAKNFNTFAEAEAAYRIVPRGTIAPSGTHIQALRRARFLAADLDELAASICSVGLLEPLIVRPHPAPADPVVFELVSGERRWLAALRANLPVVPVLVRELSDMQVLETQLVENLQREGLGPLEEAEGYRELMRIRALTPDQLAAMIGKSRSWVYSRLKLLQLLPAAQDALARGALDASRALIVARIGDPKRQMKALELAIEKDWKGDGPRHSVRGLEELLAGDKFSQSLRHAPFALDDTTFWRFEKMAGQRGRDEDCIPLPACHACEHYQGNHAPDATDPDVCTNVPCYEKKRAQHAERYRKQLEAEGRRILTGDAAKAILPRADKTVGHLDLDATLQSLGIESPERYPDPLDGEDEATSVARYAANEARVDAWEQRTVREVLGTNARFTPADTVVLVEDPKTKAVRELLELKVARTLLKDHEVTLPGWFGKPEPQRTAR